MVSIVKRRKGNHIYYYLKHHARGRQREIYLGRTLPDNIEEIKQQFLVNFYRTEWFPILENIHKNFVKERKSLPKSAQEKSIETFTIDFTYNTQRIEGSTLTLKETALLLQEGIAPANRPIREIKETEAHRKLFIQILNEMHDIDLSLETMLEWHKNLFRETKPDIAGRIRDHRVKIAGSRYIPPPPQVLRLLLKEFFAWYDRNRKDKKLHPVELAALVHFKVVSIHPFTDGNGRISRLIMNYVLSKFAFPMLDIKASDANSYYNALERSNLRDNDVIFLKWFMSRYFKANRQYIGGKHIKTKIS
ncbi:MAG: Fic family protein [Candidatus Nitrosomirales archaeon]|jgi:Fic family protein